MFTRTITLDRLKSMLIGSDSVAVLEIREVAENAFVMQLDSPSCVNVRHGIVVDLNPDNSQLELTAFSFPNLNGGAMALELLLSACEKDISGVIQNVSENKVVVRHSKALSLDFNQLDLDSTLISLFENSIQSVGLVGAWILYLNLKDAGVREEFAAWMARYAYDIYESYLGGNAAWDLLGDSLANL